MFTFMLAVALLLLAVLCVQTVAIKGSVLSRESLSNSDNNNGLNNNFTVTWTGGWSCTLSFHGSMYRCALGKNGVSSNKQEGDGKTPLGTFKLRRAFYRRDKTESENCFGVSSYLNCTATETTFGWVDEPKDPLYNQFVYLPYNASHEELYLQSSSVYDLMAVIGYNDDPVVPYAGSAIFFHVASSGYGSTAGCVSMAISDLITVLSGVQRDTWMIIKELD
jgi:L,D-peptidoglycan transpeptidase YkuD (ErfK/YbiS/YcfS/YnhG family)